MEPLKTVLFINPSFIPYTALISYSTLWHLEIVSCAPCDFAMCDETEAFFLVINFDEERKGLILHPVLVFD